MTIPTAIEDLKSKSVITRFEKKYEFPEVVLKVSELLDDEDSTIADLEEVLRLDPIFNLKKNALSVHEFVNKLEEVIIRTVGEYGVLAGRDPRNRGAWVGNAKIGSIGIRIRRGFTFHGLALNVNLSLEPFSWINPCGLMNVSVTSMEKEADRDIGLPQIKWTLFNTLGEVYGVDLMKTEITSVLTDYYATQN